MKALVAFVRREPPIIGAAIAGTIDGACVVAHVDAATQGVVHGVVLLWVAVFVRSLSTPTATADAATAAAKAEGEARVAEATANVDERVEVAKYVGAVEHQAVAATGAAVKAQRAAARRRIARR